MEKASGIGGVFFRARDPEGNPVELWQPAGRDEHGPATGA